MPIFTNPDLILFAMELRRLAIDLQFVRAGELTRLGCDYAKGYRAASQCPDRLREAASKLREAGFDPEFADQLDEFAEAFEIACVEPMFGEGMGPAPEYYQSWLSAGVEALLAAVRLMDHGAAETDAEFFRQPPPQFALAASSVGC